MIKNFLYLIILSVFCYPSYAQNPPQITNIVYRVDVRPPDEIVSQGGFLTWSQTTNNPPNNNIASHIEGDSLGSTKGNSTSNFISTSSSLVSVIEYGLSNHLTPNVRERFYIYRIRPNNNFYNVNASLRNARDSQPHNSSVWNMLDSLLTIYEEEEEISSLGSIPADRIVQYAEVTIDLYYQHNDEILKESFWENRWVDFEGYNHQYDNDRSSSEFYAEISPRGVIQMAVDERNGIEVPLSHSCMGSPSFI